MIERTVYTDRFGLNSLHMNIIEEIKVIKFIFRSTQGYLDETMKTIKNSVSVFTNKAGQYHVLFEMHISKLENYVFEEYRAKRDKNRHIKVGHFNSFNIIKPIVH